MFKNITKFEMDELVRKKEVEKLSDIDKAIRIPKQERHKDFCRMYLSGYRVPAIAEMLGVELKTAYYWSREYRPFLTKKMVELKEMRRGEDLIIIRQRIKAKEEEIEKDPSKDTASLHDWVKLDLHQMGQEPMGRLANGGQPIIQIIDNRTEKPPEPTKVEVEVKEPEKLPDVTP